LEASTSALNHVLGEIARDEQKLVALQTSAVEISQESEHWKVEKSELEKAEALLEKGLSELGLKYCEMSEALLGQSVEVSQEFLRSIQENPNCESCQASPLLQKYAKVANEIKKVNKAVNEISWRLNDSETSQNLLQAKELREKLISSQTHRLMLRSKVEDIKEEIAECASKILSLDNPSFCEDLVSALKWTAAESCGLFQPSLNTSAFALLFFQQFKHSIASSTSLTPSSRLNLSCLQPGDFIDAKDDHGTWYESVISAVDRDAHTVTIHFRGWAHKFDRILSISPESSTEIAPLFTQTENWRAGLRIGDRVDYTKCKMVQEKGRTWIPAYVMALNPATGILKLKYCESDQEIISEVDGVDLYGESICKMGTHLKREVKSFASSPVNGTRWTEVK
jgi:hypothetical protein